MYTTDDLITYIKLYGALPNQQPAFTDNHLLLIANNELFSIIVPFIMSNREEYFVTSTDTSIVTDQDSYDIPTQAVGGILRELKIYNNTEEIINVARVGLDQEEYHSEGFYIKDNKITFLYVNNYRGYTLKLYYFRRPNELITTTDTTYGTSSISSIDTGTDTVTVTSIPTGWTNATKVDLIQAKPPFNLLAEDQTITISGSDITFSSLPSSLAEGDYVTFTGKSPIPMIPAEAHYLLAQAVTIKVMESLRDQAGMQLAISKYKQIEEYLKNLFSPRVQGEAKRIINFHNFIDMPRRRIYPG